MSKDSCFIIGKCTYKDANDIDKTYVGGDMDLNQSIANNIMLVEGVMGNGISNKNSTAKGFLKNDIDLENMITLIAFEYPLKKGPNNTIYFSEKDLSEIIDDPKLSDIEGKYKGIIFTGVTLKTLSKKDLENMEISGPDFVSEIIGMDFKYQKAKEYKTKIEIQKYNKPTTEVL